MKPTFQSDPPLKKPAAIIFDWDDTLSNHKPIADKGMQRLIHEYSAKPNTPLEQVWDDWSKSKKSFCDKYFPEMAREEVDRQYRRILAPLEEETKLLPGAHEVLKYAKEQKIPLAIGSNRLHSGLIEQSKKLGLFDYFDSVIGRENLDHIKPDPHIFVESVKALGLPLENIWIVGDSMDDVGAARSNGFQRILIGDKHREHTQNHAVGNDPAGDIIYLDDLFQLEDTLREVCVRAQYNASQASQPGRKL